MTRRIEEVRMHPIPPPGPAVPPPWQGIHHLALATRDLDATVRFYRDVLGMPVLLEPPSRPDGPRHLFIDAGGGAALHFWEVPEAAIFAQPLEPGPPVFVPGALQHLALKLPDEAALQALRERLRAAGVEATDLFQQGSVRLCFFHDNNGLVLEAACWLADPTRPSDDF
jgi:catechol 2,3-dioxygenase-like lactoylglutathione lyase family enzyme